MIQRADLAIADLTITYDREQAVDFTMPFMNLGKSFAYASCVMRLYTYITALISHVPTFRQKKMYITQYKKYL
jgi:hypothetical protein